MFSSASTERQGTDYATDEETDELKAVGLKMKAEGETAYELVGDRIRDVDVCPIRGDGDPRWRRRHPGWDTRLRRE